MDNLLNELNNGTVEYLDGGEVKTNPPTSLALRASRAIRNLIDQVNNAVNTSNSLNIQYNKVFADFQQLKEKYDAATRNVSADANVESVRESDDSGKGQETKDEASDVAVGDGDPNPSNQDGSGS